MSGNDSSPMDGMTPDPTTPDVLDPAPPSPDQDERARSAVEKLFAQLVPPDHTVKVEDVTGQAHNLRTTVPAAVETRLLRLVRELLSLQTSSGALAAVVGTNTQGVAAVARMLAAVTDPEAVRILGEMFRIAHPVALAKARDLVAGDETLMAQLVELDEVRDASELRTEHCFSMTAIVEGIYPFFARGGAKIKPVILSMLTS